MLGSYRVSEKDKKKFNFQPSPKCRLRSVALNDLTNLSGFIIFIWLKNKKRFWFKVITVNRNTIEGYSMGQNFWRYNKINLFNIYGYF